MDVLIKQERKLFHTRDLALLWRVENDNTLYTQIKRYVQKGILIPIQKGFYATVPLEKIDPVLLGISFLHQYAYLSGEWVLAKEGIIFQDSPYITLISSVSRKFKIGGWDFLVRKMKKEFLYQPSGIAKADGYSVASRERAVADILYFNPHYHFDAREMIDWQEVLQIQKEVGYQ